MIRVRTSNLRLQAKFCQELLSSLFFFLVSLLLPLFLSLSCFSNLTLFPPANYQLILVNYLLIISLAVARS